MRPSPKNKKNLPPEISRKWSVYESGFSREATPKEIKLYIDRFPWEFQVPRQQKENRRTKPLKSQRPGLMMCRHYLS